MKKVLTAAILAALAASPAVAAKHIRGNTVQGNYVGTTPQDSLTVVYNGKVIGRDPDARISLDLFRQGDPAQLPGGR